MIVGRHEVFGLEFGHLQVSVRYRIRYRYQIHKSFFEKFLT
jgi:hypothetical protein